MVSFTQKDKLIFTIMYEHYVYDIIRTLYCGLHLLQYIYSYCLNTITNFAHLFLRMP